MNYVADIVETRFNESEIIYEIVECSMSLMKEKWLDAFASHLSKELINKHYINRILWHVFSYDTREYLIGTDALNSLNETGKDECYIFFGEYDIVYKIKNGEKIDSLFITLLKGMYIDMYIVDKNFKWTYIKTHEEADDRLGPFFAYRLEGS